MKRLLIFLLISMVLATAATLLYHFLFPSREEQPDGKMIRIRQNKVMHSVRSEKLFRHLCQKAQAHPDSLYRIAIVALSEKDEALRDSLAHELRILLHDPRIGAKWEWSLNWQSDKAPGIFARPSRPMPVKNGNPHEDFTEAWLSCSTDSLPGPARITAFCRNTDESASLILVNDSLIAGESTLPVSPLWQCIRMPALDGKNQLYIRCEKSPLFGNITIEPASGLSTWNLRLPSFGKNRIPESVKSQAACLGPELLILVCDHSNREETESGMQLCRKLFGQKPVLLYTSSLQFEKAAIAETNNAAFLSAPQAASIVLVLPQIQGRLPFRR